VVPALNRESMSYTSASARNPTQILTREPDSRHSPPIRGEQDGGSRKRRGRAEVTRRKNIPWAGAVESAAGGWTSTPLPTSAAGWGQGRRCLRGGGKGKPAEDVTAPARRRRGRTGRRGVDCFVVSTSWIFCVC
jgi:hypothetical protein